MPDHKKEDKGGEKEREGRGKHATAHKTHFIAWQYGLIACCIFVAMTSKVNRSTKSMTMTNVN